MGTIISGVVGGLALLGSVVALWVKRKSPAATPTPTPAGTPAAPANGFSAIAQKVLALVAMLDLGDADKHDLVSDLLKVIREYVTPEEEPGTMADHLKALMDDFLAKMNASKTPPPPPPMASPVSS